MMQAYAEYKDSGVEWLGEVPAGWFVKRLKHYGKMYAGLTGKNGEDFSKDPQAGYSTFVPFTSIANGDVVKPSRQYVRVSDFEYQNKVSFGDILFLMSSETIEDIGKNSIFLDERETPFLNSFCKGFRLNRVGLQSNFANYLLQSDVYRNYFARVARGFTRINLKQEFILNADITIPPLTEQTAIADFLGEKTTKIEALVEIKRRQIELLGERKQILIQNAVTKGLNPAAPMKDSGVDWIGTIPAHWEVKAAKHLFFEVDERSENGDEELLSVSHMTGVTPRSEKTVSMFLAEDYSGSKICVEGDLVFNIMWAWMGALGVSAQLGIVSPSYAVFRQLKSQPFNPVYLEMLMQSLGYIEHYNKVSTGLHSSRLRFYSHMFLSMKIGYPPFEEQERIVQFLVKETGKISKAISVLENQITKLNEYKTTLINAAVTGKIKVA